MGRFDNITSYLFSSGDEEDQDPAEELDSIKEDIEHIDYLISKSARLETAQSEIDRMQAQVESLEDDLPEGDEELSAVVREVENRLDQMADEVEDGISAESTGSEEDSHLVSTINGINPQLAKVLYDAGLETRSDVTNATESELKAINELADALAEHLAEHNRIEDGYVVTTTDGTFRIDKEDQ